MPRKCLLRGLSTTAPRQRQELTRNEAWENFHFEVQQHWGWLTSGYHTPRRTSSHQTCHYEEERSVLLHKGSMLQKCFSNSSLQRRGKQLCRTASYHLCPWNWKQPAGLWCFLYLLFPARLTWIRQNHWVQGGCCWLQVSKLSPCPLLMVVIFTSLQCPCHLPGTQKNITRVMPR